MTWLLLSIVCSTLIFAAFKLFDRYRVSNLQAIVANYFVAFITGQFVNGFDSEVTRVFEQEWGYSVFILGFLFITLFQLMAYVSQTVGVSATSVAVKMSVIVPVAFSVLRYDESAGFIKITGIALALIAVVLATYKPHKVQADARLAWLPLILFAGSGFLDTFLKYNQQELVAARDQDLFTAVGLGMSGVYGLFFIAYQKLRGNLKLQWRALLGGIALGIPNYGSIYFLLRALEGRMLESSLIFPLNNVGIVLLSVLLGVIAFREKLSRLNILGILLALVAIMLIFINR